MVLIANSILYFLLDWLIFKGKIEALRSNSWYSDQNMTVLEEKEQHVVNYYNP